MKLEVGVGNFIIVGAYGSGMENSKEERKVFWLKLIEEIAGCGSVEVVCFLGHMNAQVGGVKISGV